MGVAEIIKAAGVAAPKLPTAAAGRPFEQDLFDSDAQQIQARTIIFYGDSGLGKSTEAAKFARLMYELTGKPSRLITFEDSSKSIFEPLINSDLVDPLFLCKCNNPLVVLRRVAKGDWPLFKEDGNFENWQAISDWRGNISAYIVEGLTSGAESLLEQCREQGWFMREQKADSVETMGERINPASQTAYGQVQSEILRAVKSFGMLPVERVLWTAHEAAGSDQGEPIRGPGLVGRAGTASVQKFCGMLLHVDGVKEGASAVLKPRIFYKRHLDTRMPTLSYPAKTTIPGEQLAELDKRFPGGYFDPGPTYAGVGLNTFIRLEMELIKSAAATLDQWKAELKAKKDKK